MSKLTDRANYLRGLAEGMKLNPEKDSNRVLLELLDLVAEMASELEALDASQQQLSDFVDMMDDDLSTVEEILSDDEEEDWDEDGEEEDAEDDDISVTYTCPHCGEEITLSLDDLDLEDDMPCPACGKPLFPGADEEAEEEAEGEGEDKADTPAESDGAKEDLPF